MSNNEKPTIPEVLARFRAYYQSHPTWGSLHIVLDDGNVKNADVEFCKQYAHEHDDREGYTLACILLTMSATQRKALPSHV